MPDSTTTPKQVILKGDPVIGEAVMFAGAAIRPGMLIERRPDGTVQKNDEAAAGLSRSARLFAIEPGYRGGHVDTVYVNGETVPFASCRPGDNVYAFLKAGAGGDVAIGALLQSAADGSLMALDADGFPVAMALQAVDNDPGVGDALARIIVEVL